MLKVKDFDYDLWTTNENGTKRYWAKVRKTGEITEISHDVMKLLRNEEKRTYRHNLSVKNSDQVLSLEYFDDEEKEDWLEDHTWTIEMDTALVEGDFKKMLTPIQLEVFKSCMLDGCGIRKFAREKGISHKAVEKTIAIIKRKFNRYFF